MQRFSRTAALAVRVAQRSVLRVNASALSPASVRYHVSGSDRRDLGKAQLLQQLTLTDFQGLSKEQVSEAFRFNPEIDIDDAAYHALWAKAGRTEKEFLETSAQLAGLFEKNVKDYADMCTDLVKQQLIQQHLEATDLQGLTAEQGFKALSLDPCDDIDDAAYHALWEKAGCVDEEFLRTSAKLAGLAKLAGHHQENFKDYAHKCSQAVKDAGHNA